jgi:peptide/nickel transport system permease protein
MLSRPLWGFVARRLLLAIPTLFGISLVTFALIHLAPGDMAAGPDGQLMSKREVERRRRLFFLDLPLFYNSDPRGVRARSARICRLLKSDLQAGARLAAGCGSACFSDLLGNPSICKTLPQAAKNALWTRAKARHDWLSAKDVKGSLARTLAPDRLSALVEKLRMGDAEARRQLRAAGTAALVFLLPKVIDEGDARCAALAGQLAGVFASAPSSADQRVSSRERSRWREWWRVHKRRYARFSSGERFWGRLTETQYAKWLSRLLTFSFGYSNRDGRSVSTKIGEALPVTLLLGGLSMFFAYLFAVPLGVHSAVRRGSRSERLSTMLLFLLYSMPSFFLAMLLILLFCGSGLWDWFPVNGLATPGSEQWSLMARFFDRLWHLVLPVIAMSAGSVAVLSRYQRGAMLEVLQKQFILAARARGLSEKQVIVRHGLRNALLPTITLLGLHFPAIISGSVIIERIFDIPGMGLLTFEAFLQRDYPVIMGVTFIAAAVTLLGLLVSDLLYLAIDPRIRVRAGLQDDG